MLLFVVPVILLIVLLGYAKQSENQGTEEPLETEESKMPETAESLPEEPEIVYDPPEYQFTPDEITVYIGGLTEEYRIAFVNDLHLVTDTEVGHVLEEELPEVELVSPFTLTDNAPFAASLRKISYSLFASLSTQNFAASAAWAPLETITTGFPFVGLGYVVIPMRALSPRFSSLTIPVIPLSSKFIKF